ncbi:FATTY ACID REDUCTASE 3, ECERIFERUM 4 [Hibiscus trionum]|uniref:Fatty acyl-CoA reductase n=1 Tax=Hibiscus trionum TaxID=183268 RepID=A0A9W7HC27_HIBTR|nr:FATTY ACID REDUCTASE 3, ECERIFERUM 4 [Hibiscus trionum]
MGETLNGVSGLDINVEKEIVEHKLNELRMKGASDKEITRAMKDLGIQRARFYGWPNTYAFSKAMGEMVVGELKERLPIGKLPFFIGDVDSVLDLIPADMVVNAMIVAIIAHASKQPSETIYQVGSSMRNPVKYCNVQDFAFRYFSNKPWINNDGKPVIFGTKIRVLDSMPSFHQYMALRYLLPLKGLGLVNTAFCHLFQGIYSNLKRKINYVTRMVDIYRPYLFNEAIFDYINIEKLRMSARSSLEEYDMFYFDPKCIDWDYYFMNIHIPGIVKYIFK